MAELSTEERQRIMVEVDLGIAAADSQVPASPERDAFRATMEREIAELHAKGLGVKPGNEFPRIDLPGSG